MNTKVSFLDGQSILSVSFAKMLSRSLPLKKLFFRCSANPLQKRAKCYHVSTNYIVNSGFDEVAIPNVTLPQFFGEYHEKFHDFTAIVSI